VGPLSRGPTFLVTLPDGSQCSYAFDLEVDGCDEDQVSRRAKPQVEPERTLVKPSLTLRPNPSSGSLLVDYAVAPTEAKTVTAAPLSLTFYDVRGQALRQQWLPASEGTWRADLRTLPEGLYLVVLRQGTRIITQQKLSLIR
jgi:hypothetical protein